MSNIQPTTASASAVPLALPSPSTLPVLLGRSNYTTWHSAIHPSLACHRLASALLSGSWTEPRPLRPVSSPAPNISARTRVKAQAQALAAWDHANLALCRFIRGTLAMNVLPFVRRYTEAKALWDALVGLYGEANGIAMAGGGAALNSLQGQRKAGRGRGDERPAKGKEREMNDGRQERDGKA